MAKAKYECRVTGRGAFPIDMLRYDQAYPMNETDSVAISASLDRLQPSMMSRSVRLISEQPLTSARWSSFGWQVDEMVARRY